MSLASLASLRSLVYLSSLCKSSYPALDYGKAPADGEGLLGDA